MMTCLPSMGLSMSLMSLTAPEETRAAAVAGDGDEVEGVVHLDGAGEVGEEDGCAFEHADQDDGFALVVGGDLRADLAGAVGDLLPGEGGLPWLRRREIEACLWWT